ncbi:hypothetical protein HDU90_008133 [Geranomyces variabilis]|nr:hypothetical protein HDU90_008133 [Geranomyces variabilis]
MSDAASVRKRPGKATGASTADGSSGSLPPRPARREGRFGVGTISLIAVAALASLFLFGPLSLESVGLGGLASTKDRLVSRNLRGVISSAKSRDKVLKDFKPDPYKVKQAEVSAEHLYPISACPVPAAGVKHRMRCGNEDMTIDDCIAARCCWSPTKAGPSCYVPPKQKSKHAHTIPRPDKKADPNANKPLSPSQISALQNIVSGTKLSRRDAPPASACQIDITKRVDCGVIGTTQAQCAASNCCWNPTAGGPSCFSTTPLPNFACKTTSVAQRVDCGNASTTATSCAASGCCWVPLPAGTAGPYCYNAGSCAVDAPNRVDAGNVNTTAASCTASGACWGVLPAGTPGPFCYNPSFGPVANTANPATCPAVAQDPAKRIDCGFNGMTQAQCVANNCCWGSLTAGTAGPWCYKIPDAPSGQCVQTPATRVNCGDAQTTAATCQAAGCCWSPLAAGVPGPYCFTPGSPQPGSDVAITLAATTPTPGFFYTMATAPVAAWATVLLPNTGKILVIERFAGGKVGTTHVYEFDYNALTFRALHVVTDIFCSGGFLLSDGRVVSFGGYTNDAQSGQALTGARIFTPSGAPGVPGTTDWFENAAKLALQVPRWYPTISALPDGRIIVVGGTTDVQPPGVNQPSIEFFGATPQRPPQTLQFLIDSDGNNLYPFVLNVPAGGQIPAPGALAIFANNRIAYYDVTSTPGTLIELFRSSQVPIANPDIYGQRVYPLAGGLVTLPVVPDANNVPLPMEIMICGGSTNYNINATAVDTCVRGFPQQGPNTAWTLEKMPTPRLFPDLVHLPDGTVLIINGAAKGWSGFAAAQNPVTSALIYNSSAPAGNRFTVVATSPIARLYHSLAVLSPDGRVFVLGSTPNADSNINDFGPIWPDEYRIEAYVPAYKDYKGAKPSISAVTFDPNTYSWTYDQSYTVTAVIPSGNPANVKLNIITGGFITHANHMGQNMVYLRVTNAVRSTAANAPANTFVFTVRAPKSAWVALQGYYMLWVVENNMPCTDAYWVQIGNVPAITAGWHPENA